MPQAVFCAQGGTVARQRARQHAIVGGDRRSPNAEVIDLANVGDIPFDHPERGLGGTSGERDDGNKADGGAKGEAPTHFRSSYHMKIRLSVYDCVYSTLIHVKPSGARCLL